MKPGRYSTRRIQVDHRASLYRKRPFTRRQLPHITEEALAAYQIGDYLALHRALKLKPWEPSPLSLADSPLGVDQGSPPEWMTSRQREDYRKAQAIQRQLDRHLKERAAS